MRLRVLIVSVTLVAGVPLPCAADGAWTTFLRAFTYTDLVVRGDTVWCATLDAGLVRYVAGDDRFDAFVREPGGLAANSIAAITFDRSSRLWVGTLGRGASRLDPNGAWALVNAFDGLPSDSVNVVEADGDTVWLGTTRGLALWNGREIAGVLPDGSGPSPFASNRITGIAVVGDSLWVATELGVYRGLISAGLATWTAINTGLPASLRVEGFACDGTSIVALSNLGAYRRDPGVDSWSVAGGIGAVRRVADDAGRITAATGRGVYLWSGGGWTQVYDSPASGVPRENYAVGVGADGSIYAANMNGLRNLPGGALRFPPGPPGNNVLNLDVEGPRLYVNTLGDGVGRFDGVQWRHWFPGAIDHSDTSFRDPRFVFALLVDRDGKKWFGQWAALRRLEPCEPDTGLIEVMDDSVVPPRFTHMLVEDGLDPARHSFARSAALDRTGGRWFGFGSPCAENPAFVPIGLDHYDSTGAFIRNYRPANTPDMRGTEVRALAVDADGRVWVGYKGQGIDHFPLPGPSGDLDIVSLAGAGTFDVRGIVARGDSIWVYTTSELRRYRKSTKLTAATYLVPAGPAESATRPLDVGPDGSAWLGSVNGVRRYRPDGTIQDFTTANSPLADDEVRAIRVDPTTGVVWIGTARGVNRYDPAFAPTSPKVPRLEVHAYPNPSWITQLGVRLHVAGNVTHYEGAIVDLSGRILHRFSARNGDVFWDGREQSGAIVQPGVYLVRVEALGLTGAARFVLLR